MTVDSAQSPTPVIESSSVTHSEAPVEEAQPKMNVTPPNGAKATASKDDSGVQMDIEEEQALPLDGESGALDMDWDMVDCESFILLSCVASLKDLITASTIPSNTPGLSTRIASLAIDAPISQPDFTSTSKRKR